MTAQLAPPAPAFFTHPEYDESDGDLAVGQAEQVGLDLYPHQRRWLDAAYAVGARGRPACSRAAIVGPRQTVGKTAVLEVAALADLFIFGVRLHVWTAHLYPTAKKSFENMVRLIDGVDDLRRVCRKPRTANGDEKIQLLTGEAIEFRARSKGGGRGFSGVERVTLDEALFLSAAELGAISPTKVTMPSAQQRYGSSAGLDTSEALRALRDVGRPGLDKRLAYLEYAARRHDCATPDCSHLPGRAVGCALDDRELWLEANPTLGREVEWGAVADQRAELPPEEFQREFLSWWDEPAELVPLFGEGLWEACAVPHVTDGGELGSQIKGPPTFAVAAALYQEWACIGAAGPARGPGLGKHRTHLEVVEHRRGVGWVVDRVRELAAKWEGCRFVVDKRGPAGDLIPALLDAKVPLVEASKDDLCNACAAFARQVHDGGLVHLSDVRLDGAVAGAQKRDVGDRYAWGRKTTIDISPLEAVTLAAWGAGQAPARGGFNIY